MATIEVDVLFFAAARERVGRASEKVQLARGATVQTLMDELSRRHASLQALWPHLRIAVNQDFASAEAQLPDAAEVALIPPVAGGAGLFRLCSEALNLQDVVEKVQRAEHGGVVGFQGVVRNQTKGKRVLRLEYEAYPAMAEKKMAEIAEEVSQKWPGTLLAIHHRAGTLEPGELAVVMAASAPHRQEAFRACEYAIERLKQDVPIWKKEHFEDGTLWVGLGP